jgi:hypothetical protein
MGDKKFRSSLSPKRSPFREDIDNNVNTNLVSPVASGSKSKQANFKEKKFATAEKVSNRNSIISPSKNEFKEDKIRIS